MTPKADRQYLNTPVQVPGVALSHVPSRAVQDDLQLKLKPPLSGKSAGVS